MASRARFTMHTKLLVNQHTPNLGAHVWYWHGGKSVSRKVMQTVTRANGRIFYWLGQYSLNKTGQAFCKEREQFPTDYLSALLPKSTWHNKGYRLKHLSKVWVEGSLLSYPHEWGEEKRFEHPFNSDQLVKRIRQLERKLKGTDIHSQRRIKR